MERDEAKSQLEDQFILHWGEMGGRWGINRAIAQIHAILLLSENPLTAQEISDRLQIARSNISTGLKELQTWGLVTTAHQKGDRREFFSALKDPWEIFTIIADRRLERELEPTISFLEKLTNHDKPQSPKIFDELYSFLKSGVGFYRRMRKLPRPLVRQIMKLDSKLTRALESGEK